MKKVLNFLATLVLPRKMYKYHEMKIIYSVGIFLLSMVVLLLSINLTTKHHMYEKIQKPDFEKYDFELINEKSINVAIINDQVQNVNMPKYKIATSNSGGFYLDIDYTTDTPDTFKGIFTRVYKNTTTNRLLEVKIILDETSDFFDEDNQTTLFDERLIDLGGYLKQDRDENTDYLLCAFTRKSFYYLYNLGQVKENNKWVDTASTRYGAYEVDANGEYIYYLPTVGKEAEELENKLNSYGKYDTSLWSTITTEGASETYTLSDGSQITLTAEKKLRQNVRYMIYNGEYIYSNVDQELLNNDANLYNSDFKKVMINLIDAMAEADTNIQKSFYTIFVMVINLGLSLLWVLITWLLSRKFVMNKFREYYAICSITYLTSSVLGCILGFFIRFDTLMLIMLAIELMYYIVVTFRINTDPNLLNPKDDDSNNDTPSNTNKPDAPAITFKKIKTHDTYTVE